MIDPATEAMHDLPPGGLVIVAGSRPGVGVTSAVRALQAALAGASAGARGRKSKPVTILDVGVVGEWTAEDRPAQAADLVLLVVHEGCMPGHVHRLASRLIGEFRAETILIHHRDPVGFPASGDNITIN
ncbi:hypothetical protein AB8880_02105 [Alphaproteobacteria bacterium LSUCC0684]